MKTVPGSAVGWQLLALIGTGKCASNHYIAEEARPLPSIDAKNSRVSTIYNCEQKAPLH